MLGDVGKGTAQHKEARNKETEGDRRRGAAGEGRQSGWGGVGREWKRAAVCTGKHRWRNARVHVVGTQIHVVSTQFHVVRTHVHLVGTQFVFDFAMECLNFVGGA